MAIKIKFDSDHNIEKPTMILATRSGQRIGVIPATNIHFKDGMSTFSEFSFNVNKNDCAEPYNTDGRRNLMQNTLYPSSDMATVANRPSINGISSMSLSGSNTKYPVEHGVGIRNTGNVRPYINFTNSAGNDGLSGLTAGETYTLSFHVRYKMFSGDTATSTRYLCAYLYDDHENPGTMGSNYTSRKLLTITNAMKGVDQEQDFFFTFSIPAEATMINLRFIPTVSTASLFPAGDYIELCNLKLERGSNATAWTPAPEDIDASGTFWDKIKDFKLMYCREFDTWYELSVEINESDSITKVVSAKSLGESELSQINLYNVEINTEKDIAREDYTPTVLYDNTDKSASLLDRILEKAPHYSIGHVDSSIAGIQRTFPFDGKSIYDSFKEIEEQIDCLFRFDCGMSASHGVKRVINVYDLESSCIECGYRGNIDDACPKCGSKNIKEGFGNDTTILVTAENLAEEIQMTSDTGSVKNCFRLIGGDDLMTATIANCNPSGTNYIWKITDSMLEDMSDALASKIKAYEQSYDYYQNTYTFTLDSALRTKYNALITKYQTYDSSLTPFPASVVGYPALMNAYYDATDLYLLLSSGLMPTPETQNTTAQEQVERMTSANLSPVAVSNLSTCSKATATSAVQSAANTLVDYRYHVKANGLTYENGIWTGTFTVTNYSDEEDTATGGNVTITVNDDLETFLRQKINNQIGDGTDNVTDIVELFSLSASDFENELKKYCYNRLLSFYDAARSAIDILIQQGIADNETWGSKTPNLYQELYVPYYAKLQMVEAELNLREREIAVIVGEFDTEGLVTTAGVMTAIDDARYDIHKALDFESYLGEELRNEFAAFRREDEYENDNYISDGLNNAELFKSAEEFIQIANKEIERASELAHSISSPLKNLLVMDAFKPLVDHFEVGNWLRERVDGKLYKLRLIDYSIDYDNLDTIDVTFSDTKSSQSDVVDLENILSKAVSISTSYDAVVHQADQGRQSNSQIREWMTAGLALTKMKIVDSATNQNVTLDSHGLLCREYLPFSDTYDDRQLKIINRGLYLTDDNWQTSKAGIGDFIFYNPKTKQYEQRYGVVAEAVVAPIMLSEDVGVYTEGNNVSIDKDGIKVTDDSTTVTINPQSDDGVFVIENEDNGKVFWVDKDGNGHYTGIVEFGDPSSGETVDIRDVVNQTIDSITPQYYESTSATSPAGGSWSNTPPSTRTPNTYLWVRNVYKYVNGTTETGEAVCTEGVPGESGAAGADGMNSTTLFLYKRAASAPSKPAATTFSFDTQTMSPVPSGWSTSVPSSDSAGNPCWVSTAFIVDASKTVSVPQSAWTTPTKLVQDGNDGVGITGVTEYYAASASSTTAPTSWGTSIPSDYGATKKYLWNYEHVAYTDSAKDTDTVPAVIGVYGVDGQSGVSITSITEHYLATSASSGVTRSTTGWTTTIQTVDATNKYLWNYETINYSSGNPQDTDPVIIGTYGDKGDDGLNVATVTLYMRSASTPTKRPGATTLTFSTGVVSGTLNGWSQHIPATNGNPCWAISTSASSSADTYAITAAQWNASTIYKFVTDGADAVIHSIDLSSYVVVYDPNTGLYSPNSVTATMYKTTGDEKSKHAVYWYYTVYDEDGPKELSGAGSATTSETITFPRPSVPGAIAVQLYAKEEETSTEILDSQYIRVVNAGLNGSDGAKAYVHFAYSTSSDGSQNFSTSSFDGAKYIGVRADTTSADSQVYTDYEWSLMAGENATAYSLIVSNAAIVMDKSGEYNPSSVTLNSKSQTGSGAITNYAGRFKVETSMDGLTWDSGYESSSDESSHTYSLPGTSTASGPIASFPDGADGVPVKSLTVDIGPVQDLNGYDNPWPAGGGKNLLENIGTTGTSRGVTATFNSDGTVALSGTNDGSLYSLFLIQNEFQTVSGVEYILSGAVSNQIVIRDVSAGVSDSGGGVTITGDGNKHRIEIRVIAGTTVPSNTVVKPMIRLASVSDSTFAPYSNICPISGWTGVNVTRTGVNVWDEEWEVGFINSNTGDNVSSTTQIRSKNYIPVKPGMQVYIKSPNQGSSSPGNLAGRYYTKNKEYLGYAPTMNVGTVITIPDDCYFIRFGCQVAYGTTYNNDISINYPSTDTDYHAYQGTTYPITFPSEAGTVYGGTLDVTTGVLTVDRAEVDLGKLTWAKPSQVNIFYTISLNSANDNSVGSIMISSQYAYGGRASSNQAAYDKGDNLISVYTGADARVYVRDDRYATTIDFKAAMSGVQLVYELATPITYQLTPQEITTLLGSNNLWADVGDVDAEYHIGIKNIRCSLYASGGTTTLLDQQTIPIVSDGADGTNGTDGKDAYTVILTNENHTFPGGVSAAIASSTECQIIAYKGATQVPATIGTISGIPASGMTVTPSGSGTTSAKFAVAVTTDMTSQNGVLDVPVTVDGRVFNMKFTYSLALTGQDGDDGASMKKVNAPAKSWTKANLDTYVSKATAYTTGSSYDNTHLKVNDIAYIEFKLSDQNRADGDPVSGIVIGTVTKITTSAVTLASAYYILGGVVGADGVGISSVTVTYGQSDSSSTQPSSWSPTIPSVPDGKYLWTRTIIDYTDPSIQDTVTYSYARQGKDGDQGIAGTSVTVESIMYQEGTSAATAPTGVWYDAVVEVDEGKYLWTKTTFSDGSIAYGVAKQGVSGEDGDDAITVVLTNDNHTFAGNSAHALASSVVCSVVAYKGATQVAATIGTITGQVTGLTTDIANNGKTNAQFTVSVTTSMTTRNGVLNVPVTVDGKTFAMKFTYSLALNGQDGESAYSAYLTDEMESFAGNDSGALTAAQTATTTMYVYKGTTALNITNITATSSNSKLTCSNTGTVSGTSWTGTITAASGFSGTGTVTITATADSKTFTKVFTVSVIPKGATGEGGAAGRTYFLEFDSTVIKVDANKTISPTTFKASAYYRDGTGTRTAYSGRFVITNAAGTTVYSSASNESSHTVTASADANYYLVKLYAADGTTTLLDQQTVPVLTDVENLEIGGRNWWKNTSQSIEVTARTTGTAGDNFNYATIRYVKPVDLKKGETYTISGYVTFTSVDESQYPIPTHLSSYLSYQPTVGGATTMPVNTDGSFSKTFIVNADTEGAYRSLLYAGVAGNTRGIGATFTRLKLEKGNKATDWTPAPEDYDENFEAFSERIDNVVQQFEDDIDGMVVTWYYPYAPAADKLPQSQWTTAELMAEHVGDVFYDTITGNGYFFSYENNTYTWRSMHDTDALQAAAAAQDTADNKRRVFYSQPTPPYDIGDLWTEGSTGDLFRCKTAKATGGTFAQADWELATKYTDDTAVENLAIGGRNLFIAATRTNNMYIKSSTGAESGWSKSVLSDYISVSEGDSVIAQFWKPANESAAGDDRGWYCVSNFNSEKEFIAHQSPYGYFTSDYKNLTFTVPQGVAFIRVCFHFGVDGTSGVDWNPYGQFQVMVEKGTKPSAWSIAPEDIRSDIDAALDAAQAANTLAAGKATVYYSATQPTGTFQTGDVWFQTITGSDEQKIWTYTGSGWMQHKAGTTSIVDGTITADLLAANAVTAEKVKANAITASKLAIGDFRNYATANENYPDSGVPVNYYGASIIQDGRICKSVSTNNSMRVSELIPNDLEPGEEFYYRFTIHSDNNYSGSSRVFLRMEVSTSTVMSGTTSKVTSGSDLHMCTTEDQTFTGSLIVPETVNSAAISSFKYFGFDIYAYGSVFGQIYVKDLVIYRKTGGELIVDGSITADKIKAGSITLQKLGTDASGAITTAQSTADGAVTAAGNAQTTADNAASAASAAQSDIDNLSIGGRNLMIGTLNPSASPAASRPRMIEQNGSTIVRAGAHTVTHGIGETNTSTNYPYITFGSATYSSSGLHGLTPGETYTLSCDAKWKILSGTISATSTYYLRLYLYDDKATTGTFAADMSYNIGTVTQADRGTDMSGRCEFTFTLPANITAFYITIRPSVTTSGYFAAGDYIELENLKLEKGNRATDWSPAPEDLESKIDDTSSLLDELTTIENNTTVIDGGKILTGSIGADQIAANALTAGNIKLFGEMSVYKDATAFTFANMGGYIGYMSGLVTDNNGENPTVTNGMAIACRRTTEESQAGSNNDPNNYLIVTDSGIRMQNHYLSNGSLVEKHAYLANGAFATNAILVLPRSSGHKVGNAYGNIQVQMVAAENPNPTEMFANNTWTNADFLTNYNLYTVIFYPMLGQNMGECSLTVYAGDRTDVYGYMNAVRGYTGEMFTRQVRFDRTNKKIIFDHGYRYYNGSSEANDNACVPLYILAGNI